MQLFYVLTMSLDSTGISPSEKCIKLVLSMLSQKLSEMERIGVRFIHCPLLVNNILGFIVGALFLSNRLIFILISTFFLTVTFGLFKSRLRKVSINDTELRIKDIVALVVGNLDRVVVRFSLATISLLWCRGSVWTPNEMGLIVCTFIEIHLVVAHCTIRHAVLSRQNLCDWVGTRPGLFAEAKSAGEVSWVIRCRWAIVCRCCHKRIPAVNATRMNSIVGASVIHADVVAGKRVVSILIQQGYLRLKAHGMVRIYRLLGSCKVALWSMRPFSRDSRELQSLFQSFKGRPGALLVLIIWPRRDHARVIPLNFVMKFSGLVSVVSVSENACFCSGNSTNYRIVDSHTKSCRSWEYWLLALNVTRSLWLIHFRLFVARLREF